MRSKSLPSSSTIGHSAPSAPVTVSTGPRAHGVTGSAHGPITTAASSRASTATTSVRGRLRRRTASRGYCNALQWPDVVVRPSRCSRRFVIRCRCQRRTASRDLAASQDRRDQRSRMGNHRTHDRDSRQLEVRRRAAPRSYCGGVPTVAYRITSPDGLAGFQSMPTFTSHLTDDRLRSRATSTFTARSCSRCRRPIGCSTSAPAVRPNPTIGH